MMWRTAWLGASVIASAALAWACGSSSESALLAEPNGERGPGADAAGAGTAGPPPGATLDPVDNAVILVHAAKAQSFRLCFENELDRLPQPDSQVMPQANVVGVEVGSAVRLAPLRGPAGKVYLFEEPLIRPFYPKLAKGSTCQQLLSGATTSNLRIDLGEVNTDLRTGVHLLVVKGCTPNTALATYSTAECGPDWTASKGNLSVTEITLAGAVRAQGTLPAQVVNLSQPLDGKRAGRALSVTFGGLAPDAGAPSIVATTPALFGKAEPAVPVKLPFDPIDPSAYESTGFRVSLRGDAGPDEKVLEQSLVAIQRLSSPRDLPNTYFDAASNYVLLLLGDPGATLSDGGKDDDELRNLHFLAVPVIEPKGDAGAGDAGDAATDGP